MSLMRSGHGIPPSPAGAGDFRIAGNGLSPREGVMLTIDPTPRPLGKSDILVSPLAWGMWRFTGAVAPARALVEAAL